MTLRLVERALISVSDKSGLIPFARSLADAGVEIFSSEGTAKELGAAGINSNTIADLTGFPALLGGRVKTIHPTVFAGVLAEADNHDHLRDLAVQGIKPFQLVVVNLYDFESLLESGGAPTADLIEQIDIGGAALMRAAAKNYGSVGVVSSPDQYDQVADAVWNGGLSDHFRAELARAAFFLTASYDAVIHGWLSAEEEFPRELVVPLVRARRLRYGENPHQEAAAYRLEAAEPWWASATQLQGKELSANNLVDGDAAWRLANTLEGPAAVVVKHANPSGAAVRATAHEAFRAAWDCDPVSAFGGVVALKSPLDEQTAAELADCFIEVLVAPEVTPEAGRRLEHKRNMRLLVARPPRAGPIEHRPIGGGLILQTPDLVDDMWNGKAVSRRHPTNDELRDLKFAMCVAAFTKSNAVVLARDQTGIGIGAGDQSRVGAAERAIRQAGERSAGAVAASDAFLPFRDTVDLLAAAGITALMQPEGSIRDDEVISAADEHGLALVFGNRRHFRH